MSTPSSPVPSQTQTEPNEIEAAQVAWPVEDELADREDLSDEDDGTTDGEHYVSDLLLWIYLWASSLASQAYTSVSALLADIDRVDTEIIASVRARAIFDAAPPFAREYVRLLLTRGDRRGQTSQSWVESLALRKKRDRDRRLAAKGQPRDAVRPTMAEAIFNLVNPASPTCCPLYTADKKLTDAIANGTHEDDWARCNLFTVDKSSLNPFTGRWLQRIIGDARMANALLENPAHMELFTLSSLMDRFAHCFATAASGVFCMTCDLRHWFHQLPLPTQFRRYFQICLGKFGIVYPRAWPMGVHAAPGIAQACTWTIVLNTLNKRPGLRHALQVEWEGDFTSYLRWLPLKGGGGVFVLIDNIFVFSPDKQVVDGWQRHIREAADLFHATLKHPDGFVVPRRQHKDGTTGPLNQNEAFNRACVTNSTTATECPGEITFSGVIFSAAGTRPSKPPRQEERLENAATARWEGTHRELASIISQCMWSFRVRRISRLRCDDFMQLHKVVQPHGQQTWSSTIKLDPEQTEVLRAAYNDCRAQHVGAFLTRPLEPRGSAVALVATDASLSEEYQGTGIVYALNNNPSRFTASLGTHKHKNIVIAELSVVRDAIRAVDAAHDDVGMFVVAIDSMGAKGMLERGYSRNKAANAILDEIFRLLGQRWLFLHYVRSEHNPADEGSRGKREASDDAAVTTKWNTLYPILSDLARYSVASAVCADVTSEQSKTPVPPARRERE